MNKKVIYTCLVGNYDELRQPLVIDEDCDYICFSDDIREERIGAWQIRPIPFACKDKARRSRYVKILPHRVLPDYEWSLWIDANIQITGSELYSIVDDKIAEGGKIYQVNHCLPPRDCIYDEIRFAHLTNRSELFKPFLQYIHLRREHFPHHFGLFENNLILRQHNDEAVKRVSEDWWREFMSYSKRDQFSLMYVYWKNGLMPGLLLPADRNTRNVEFLLWTPHNTSPKLTFRYRQQLRIRNWMSHLFNVIDKI